MDNRPVRLTPWKTPASSRFFERVDDRDAALVEVTRVPGRERRQMNVRDTRDLRIRHRDGAPHCLTAGDQQAVPVGRGRIKGQRTVGDLREECIRTSMQVVTTGTFRQTSHPVPDLTSGDHCRVDVFAWDGGQPAQYVRAATTSARIWRTSVSMDRSRRAARSRNLALIAGSRSRTVNMLIASPHTYSRDACNACARLTSPGRPRHPGTGLLSSGPEPHPGPLVRTIGRGSNGPVPPDPAVIGRNRPRRRLASASVAPQHGGATPT